MELYVANGKLPGEGRTHESTLINILILGFTQAQERTLSPMATPLRYATIEDA